MQYLASTFSPMMLAEGSGESDASANVLPCPLSEVVRNAPHLKSIVSHEVTASILSALLQSPVKFNRENVQLLADDLLWVVVPKFRASEAREFTHQEVKNAGFRCFYIRVW